MTEDRSGFERMVISTQQDGTEYDDEDGRSEEDDEDEEEGSCWATWTWKVNPSESLYDVSMLRLLCISRDFKLAPCWNCWRLTKLLFLLTFNATLQLVVVARVNTLVQVTRAGRVDTVFAPEGHCTRNPASLYAGIGLDLNIGAKPSNWDCGPLWPLLMTNVSIVDVNGDGYWSKADNFTATEAYYDQRFHKEGDLDRIFRGFVEDAKNMKFPTQVRQNLDAASSKASTLDFTAIPMEWMREQQPLINMCNNVDPDLCGNLEVRGILQSRFPSEANPSYRVGLCRDTWDWCADKFGELFRYYTKNVEAACESKSYSWDFDEMVSISRYDRADKYNPKVNPSAILSPVYETFLLLILLIWWLTVLTELRDVLAWWMTMIHKSAGQTVLKGLPSSEEPEGEMIEVVSIDILTKIAITVLVILPRTIIIVLLSYIGTDFLIVADNYGDLVLNSVALGFLIEVDEYLFSGVAGEKDREEIEKLQPIEAEGKCCNLCIKFIRYHTSILLVLLVIFVSYCIQTYAYNVGFGKIDLGDAYQCLCHGEGADCVMAQVFGNLTDVPPHLLGVGDGAGGRTGKGR